MVKSSKSKAANKPKKPYKDFPLFPHATKRWAKKIRGKFHYFGPWDDPDGALQKYLDQKDDLHAGRRPREKKEGVTIRDAVNRFLTVKQNQRDIGEITARTFSDYHTTCSRIVEQFDKDRLVEDLNSEDFEAFRASLSKTRGPVALGNEVQRNWKIRDRETVDRHSPAKRVSHQTNVQGCNAIQQNEQTSNPKKKVFHFLVILIEIYI